MSTLFSELERTGMTCTTSYPSTCSTSVNSVSAVQAAVVDSVAAVVTAGGNQLPPLTSQSIAPSIQQQQQQQQQQPQQQQVVLQSNGATGGANNGNSNGGGGGVLVNELIEDQRALQVAFELSMVGLPDALTNGTNFPDLSNVTPTTTAIPPGATINSFASILPGIEDRSKKSQNMTECVPVPSSEHVAEIVGRQGCKIKALRAKTNTYIKTPVRGEEPVFVVTGRKEDVGKAKREILSAAEHFSLIRASRKPALSGINSKGAPPGPPENVPGQVTIQVRVPYRVVGLVVGPKGATIKHIQQQTHTYIVTPSRDKEPIFEVTGLPQNVQTARRQIEAHIALRTGSLGLAVSNSINGIGTLLGDEANPELLNSLCKNGFGPLLGYLDPKGNETFPQVLSSTGSRSCSSSSSSTSSKCAANSRSDLVNIWKSLSDSIEPDEGIGESPNIWSLQLSNTLGGSQCSPSTSLSPTDSVLNGGSPVSYFISANGLCPRECLVCGDKEVTAALIPCAHSMFCIECANRVCGSGDGICPVCSQSVVQAIRILP